MGHGRTDHCFGGGLPDLNGFICILCRLRGSDNLGSRGFLPFLGPESCFEHFHALFFEGILRETGLERGLFFSLISDGPVLVLLLETLLALVVTQDVRFVWVGPLQLKTAHFVGSRQVVADAGSGRRLHWHLVHLGLGPALRLLVRLHASRGTLGFGGVQERLLRLLRRRLVQLSDALVVVPGVFQQLDGVFGRGGLGRQTRTAATLVQGGFAVLEEQRLEVGELPG